MLKIVEIVLRQGLVHPITCVPCLVALETDPLEVNSKLAHHLLMNMNEKYDNLNTPIISTNSIVHISILSNDIFAGILLSLRAVWVTVSNCHLDLCKPLRTTRDLAM